MNRVTICYREGIKSVVPGLTRKADYGLRLMLEAAAGDRYVSTRSISRRQKIPYQFLRQAAAVLRDKGLIITARGPNGGVRLARPTSTVSVLDIVAAFGGVALNACTAAPPRCDRRNACPAFPAWVQAQAATEAALDETTLESLLNGRQETRGRKMPIKAAGAAARRNGGQ